MSCKKVIMQGDQYDAYIYLTVDDEALDLKEVEKIQFQIGDLVKYYNSTGESDVTYDEVHEVFVFPLSEDETLGFDSSQTYQARIKFKDGNIIGGIGGHIPIQFSETEEKMQ